MPHFGESSLGKLETAHPDLQRLFNEVIKYYDCVVLCGFRNEEEQNAAFEAGNSKLKWPYGKHNKYPSLAVDVMPYPLNWSNTAKNIEQITLFAGFVLGMAKMMNIKIRWGHDWDGNIRPDDHGFIDLPHYQLQLDE